MNRWDERHEQTLRWDIWVEGRAREIHTEVGDSDEQIQAVCCREIYIFHMTYAVRNAANVWHGTQWKHSERQVRYSWLHYLSTICFISLRLTSIQQQVGVQLQNSPTTLLFETNYTRQFQNIEVIMWLFLTSSLKRLCFYIIYVILKRELWIR